MSAQSPDKTDRTIVGPSVVDTPLRRWRDLLVGTGLAAIVLSLLASSGTLGWVEAITAFIVYCLAMAAFGVATATPDTASRTAPEFAAKPSLAQSDGLDALVALVQRFPQAAFLVDDRQRAISINARARGLFRAGTAHVLPLTALVRRPELVKMIENALVSGTSADTEIVFSGATDTVCLAQVTSLSVAGQKVALVNFEDRTDMRQAQRVRSEFLANASHELRTPLTALAGYVETMRGSAKDDVQSWDRFLGTMFEQTERMRRLIDDLQSLSRIEHHQHRVPDSVVDLSLIAREAVEPLIPLARQRTIAVEVTGPLEGLTAIASRDEMFQVIQNLVTNAIKYTQDGGAIELSFGAEKDAEAARSACGRKWSDADRLAIMKPREMPGRSFAWLRVADTGQGIPPESLPRLGERFYRVDESRGGKVKGTGLGLAIVKHIMARHRGGLNVESREGQGAAFGVWLPQPETVEMTVRQAAE